MGQITSGIRSILSFPLVYRALQNLLGAGHVRKILSEEYIQAAPGDILVDVGCGPADILEHIHVPIRYYGFDLSQAYIDAALARRDERGSFRCADITLLPIEDIPPCQIAMAIGLLHHLDDDDARRLFANLHERLALGGRLITFDCAYWADQSPVARYFINQDRGQNVRWGEQYRELATSFFSNVRLIRRDDLLNIPYSHAILECTK